MIEAPRIVLVEDEWPWAEDVTKQVSHLTPSVKIEYFPTASDFLAKIPDLINNPPELLIVDIVMDWTQPSPNPPMKPTDYNRITGGFWLYHEVSEFSTIRERPFIFCSVMDFNQLNQHWGRNEFFKGSFFLRKLPDFDIQIAEDVREVLANRPPKHATKLS